MSTDPASKGVLRAPALCLQHTPTAPVSRSPGTSGERGVVRTPRERAEEDRQEESELVRRQVQRGSLVIRRMTDEERRHCRPRPARHNQVRGR
jgi:hypothetical protein